MISWEGNFWHLYQSYVDQSVLGKLLPPDNCLLDDCPPDNCPSPGKLTPW